MPKLLTKLTGWLGAQRLGQAQRLFQSGHIAQAERLVREILADEPENAQAHYLLGLVGLRRSQGEAAVASLTRAIELDPGRAEFHNGLGLAWYGFGRLPEATRCFRQALALRPDDVGTLNNLGISLKDSGEYGAAGDCFRQVISRDAGNLPAHVNLGNLLAVQGDAAGAVETMRRAVALAPGLASAHSNLLALLNYLPGLSPRDLYQEALQFDARHAAPLLQAAVFANVPDADRELRIGYVSPDFSEHPLADFLGGLLGAHDREQFTVFAYSNAGRADSRTGRFRAQADQWRTIAGMPDEAVATLIRQDGIDILVDLAGHGPGNRLTVFARRVAPVQVSWLGWPGTTGLRAMDFRLTDAIADPPGEADELHTERLVRLPHGFLCYQPDEAPPAAPPPVLERGYVTFGSFERLAKMTPELIRAWAEILEAVPGSRLVLQSAALADDAARVRLRRAFSAQGVDPDRVQPRAGLAGRTAQLESYADVDIALDTFPYNGTATVCEALWMGVPVVALRGDRHAGRAAASLLHGAGLEGWVAENIEDYVRRACAAAGEPQQLAVLRGSLRSRLQQSPLTDLSAFVRSLEGAFRSLWGAWCEGPGAHSAVPGGRTPPDGHLAD